MIWGENPLFSETSIYIYIYYLRSSLGLELRSSFLSRQTLSFTYVTPINLGPRSPLRWFLRFLTKTTRGLLNYILFIMYVYLFIYSIIYYSLITDHLIELNLIPQVTPSCTSYCSYCFSSDLLNGIQVQFYVFPNRNPTQAPSEKDASTKHFKMRLLVAVVVSTPVAMAKQFVGKPLQFILVYGMLQHLLVLLPCVGQDWEQILKATLSYPLVWLKLNH